MLKPKFEIITFEIEIRNHHFEITIIEVGNVVSDISNNICLKSTFEIIFPETIFVEVKIGNLDFEIRKLEFGRIWTVCFAFYSSGC